MYFRATRDTTFEFSFVFVFTVSNCLGLNVQMRLNKVSELIHNSTNHQNLDSAGVSVHFQEIVDLVGKFAHTWVMLPITALPFLLIGGLEMLIRRMKSKI
jgi:hypothetical protein